MYTFNNILTALGVRNALPSVETSPFEISLQATMLNYTAQQVQHTFFTLYAWRKDKLPTFEIWQGIASEFGDVHLCSFSN